MPLALAALVAMVTGVGACAAVLRRAGRGKCQGTRRGQGRGAGPLAAHCPQSRDTASPARVGLLGQEGQDFPRDAEKPRPNPHLCLVTRRRGGQLPGRDWTGLPVPDRDSKETLALSIRRADHVPSETIYL